VQLASDIKKFQTRQKEEREKFASMMKTVETDVARTKQNVEYVKKVIQQQKFSNGAQTMTAPPTIQIPGTNNHNISIIEGGSTFMTSGQESLTERSSFLKSPTTANHHNGPQKEIQNSVPHQIILLQNQM